MKATLECSNLAALAAALTDRMLKHAEYAQEMSEEGGDAASAARWRGFRRVLRAGGELELKAALEAALDCLLTEQAVLPPCPACGGQRARGPAGEVYCTECRASGGEES